MTVAVIAMVMLAQTQQKKPAPPAPSEIKLKARKPSPSSRKAPAKKTTKKKTSSKKNSQTNGKIAPPDEKDFTDGTFGDVTPVDRKAKHTLVFRPFATSISYSILVTSVSGEDPDPCDYFAEDLKLEVTRTPGTSKSRLSWVLGESESAKTFDSVLEKFKNIDFGIDGGVDDLQKVVYLLPVPLLFMDCPNKPVMLNERWEKSYAIGDIVKSKIHYELLSASESRVGVGIKYEQTTVVDGQTISVKGVGGQFRDRVTGLIQSSSMFITYHYRDSVRAWDFTRLMTIEGVAD
jgi:hypothetical protein